MTRIAIYLGTFNFAVAYKLPDGKITLLQAYHGPTPQGKLMPSFLKFYANGELEGYGYPAYEAQECFPELVVWGLKRLLGKSYRDSKDEFHRFKYPIREGKDGSIEIPIGERVYTPIELVTLFLQQIKKDCESSAFNPIGAPIEEAIITHPAYFDDGQRNCVKESAEKVGFRRVELITEPEAAAIAYKDLIDFSSRPLIMVIDLGAGTLDIAICRFFMEKGRPVIQDSYPPFGNLRFGGIDMDDALVRKAKEIYGLSEISGGDEGRLRLEMEKGKIVLSKKPWTQRFIAIGERSYSLNLARKRGDVPPDEDIERWVILEDVLEDFLKKFRENLLFSLKKDGLGPDMIDGVILVGGPMYMPCVREVIKDVFRGNKRVEAQLEGIEEKGFPVNPLEAVARGAIMEDEMDRISKSNYPRRISTMNKKLLKAGFYFDALGLTSCSSGREILDRIDDLESEYRNDREMMELLVDARNYLLRDREKYIEWILPSLDYIVLLFERRHGKNIRDGILEHGFLSIQEVEKEISKIESSSQVLRNLLELLLKKRVEIPFEGGARAYPIREISEKMLKDMERKIGEVVEAAKEISISPDQFLTLKEIEKRYRTLESDAKGIFDETFSILIEVGNILSLRLDNFKTFNDLFRELDKNHMEKNIPYSIIIRDVLSPLVDQVLLLAEPMLKFLGHDWGLINAQYKINGIKAQLKEIVKLSQFNEKIRYSNLTEDQIIWCIRIKEKFKKKEERVKEKKFKITAFQMFIGKLKARMVGNLPLFYYIKNKGNFDVKLFISSTNKERLIYGKGESIYVHDLQGIRGFVEIKEPIVLKFYKSKVSNLVFDTKTDSLIVAGDGKKIIIYSLEKNEIVKECFTEDEILSLALHDSLLFAGGTGKIWIYEIPELNLKGFLNGHEGMVTSLVVDKEKSVLYSGESNPEKPLYSGVYVWDIEKIFNEEPIIRRLRGFGGRVTSLALNPFKKILASGEGVGSSSSSEPSKIILWDTKTLRMKNVLEAHEGWISSLTFSNDGKWLISGDGVGSAANPKPSDIFIWNVETGQTVVKIKAHKGWVNSLSFNTNILVSGGTDGIFVWNFEEMIK